MDSKSIRFHLQFSPRRRAFLRDIAHAMADTFTRVANDRIDMINGQTRMTAFRDGRLVAGNTLLVSWTPSSV